MTDTKLFQALDYILNHSNEAAIEALAEAVARRRRDLTVLNAVGNMPDPQRMAADITNRINAGISGGINAMRESVQEMIVHLLKEHAPELNEKQISDLTEAWLPSAEKNKDSSLPPVVLLSMIEQFISFSQGEMSESVDKNLRVEIGAWPQRYWNSFPAVIRQLITDYLKNKIPEKNFKTKITIALGV